MRSGQGAHEGILLPAAFFFPFPPLPPMATEENPIPNVDAEEIFQPVEAFRERFRQAFHDEALLEFERLREAAQVDEEENRATIAELDEKQRQLNNAASSRNFYTWLIILFFLTLAGGAIAALYPFFSEASKVDQEACLAWGGGIFLVSLLLLFLFFPLRKKAAKLMELLTPLVQDLTQQSWTQMEPLNQRYDWELLPRLIRKVCPMLSFDPYFTVGRLQELVQDFDLPENYLDETQSVLFAQSGTMRGNPFVFADVLCQEWGEKTYYGHLTIHWRERVTDSEGKSHWVTRSETLTATYDAPIPVYGKYSLLFYGNDAAPKLRFSRTPSSLSQAGDGFFDKMRKKSELKKLKAFSENLDDESQYTMMGNEEFELLFHSTDRSSETQFRLLFTPLAMSQMVNLLKDNQVGYGDDFTFQKLGRLNVLIPRHLGGNFSLDTDPRTFASNDIDKAKSFFLAHAEEYFRAIYFALAPYLCIPLYQQIRSARTIYGYKPGEASCEWEQESLANYLGEKHFAHPDSITRNILKISRANRRGQDGKVDVTSHGFTGVPRTTYVEVWGGDGKCHDVPVEWIEYLPVSRTSSFHVAEQIPTDLGAKVQPLQGEQRTNLDEFLEKSGLNRADAAYRRHIFAWAIPK